jgi:hypothetical protein
MWLANVTMPKIVRRAVTAGGRPACVPPVRMTPFKPTHRPRGLSIVPRGASPDGIKPRRVAHALRGSFGKGCGSRCGVAGCARSRGLDARTARQWAVRHIREEDDMLDRIRVMFGGFDWANPDDRARAFRSNIATDAIGRAFGEWYFTVLAKWQPPAPTTHHSLLPG